MIASPFTQAGPGLFENGYSPIPIMPNSKLPGTYADDSWKAAKGWNDCCTTRPSQLQINYWSRWPNAGVGVACGLGLICIDIDFEPAMDALLAMLPQSNVQKKGRKGISLFYRGNTDAIRSRNFRTLDRVGLVDLLAEGKQTVLPPSIHPHTGEPY
ncbi:bifunctional DNA primase/polymerase [Bradyrhizobium barranii]